MGDSAILRQTARSDERHSPAALVRAMLLAACMLSTLVSSHAQSASPKSPPSATAADSTNPPEKVGEALFQVHCVVCHGSEARGRVGLAPSIRNRDFLALASDTFIRETITQGRPGTAMMARPDLAGPATDAIIAYLRSLHVENPLTIQVDWNLKYEGNQAQGSEKFFVYCAPCHGPRAEGYSAGVVGTGIGLPGFLAVASDDYILQTTQMGRLGTPMQPFVGPGGLANLTEQDIKDIIVHLRHLGETYVPEPPGVYREANPALGQTLFTVNCAPCHQATGEGKIGFAPSIRNRDFLAIATDDFIKRTVHDGRAGTGMLPRPDLSEQSVVDIIGFLRALPSPIKLAIEVDPDKSFAGDPQAGEPKFQTYCAACHGPKGEGYTIGLPGTSIGLSGFLNTASDDYIFQTLKQGRLGTPMRPFLGAFGLANLQNSDAHDIIAYMRTLPSQQAPAASTDSDFE